MEGIAPDEEAVRGMLYDLIATVGGIEEIVLAGDAVTPEMVAGLTPEFANLRLWGEGDVQELDDAVDAADFGPMIAPAIGAAVQEFSRGDDAPLGVTDRVSLIARIQQVFQKDKRLAPALVVGLLLACLVGHHMLTRTSITDYRSKIEDLKKEKRKLLRPKEEKQRLTKALTDTKNRQVYLETVLAAGNNNLLDLLAVIAETLPRDVVLNRLYQKSNGSYWLEGNAYMGKSVYAFNESLSRVQGCKSTNLETIRRVEDASEARQKLLPYGFVINVNF
jgi:Tfp pilus assembly protein PilN